MQNEINRHPELYYNFRELENSIIFFIADMQEARVHENRASAVVDNYFWINFAVSVCPVHCV